MACLQDQVLSCSQGQMSSAVPLPLVATKWQLLVQFVSIWKVPGLPPSYVSEGWISYIEYFLNHCFNRIKFLKLPLSLLSLFGTASVLVYLSQNLISSRFSAIQWVQSSTHHKVMFLTQLVVASVENKGTLCKMSVFRYPMCLLQMING